MYTVDRILKQEGIKKWRAKKRSASSEIDAAERLHWTEERRG